MLEGLEPLCYEDRLEKLRVSSMEERKLQKILLWPFSV